MVADIPDRGAVIDGSVLDGANKKASEAGMHGRSVYADRGFGTSRGDAALAHHQIRDPIIPREGRPAPIEQTRSWRRRYRFCNGLEGRISNSNARAYAAPAYGASPACRPRSAVSHSPTTCNGWRSSPEPEPTTTSQPRRSKNLDPSRSQPFFRGK